MFLQKTERCFFLATWTFGIALSLDAEEPRRMIPLSPRLGPEIERAERDRYRLFPDVSGFVRAYALEAEEGPVLYLVYEKGGVRYLERRRLGSDELDALRQAVASAAQGGGSSEGRLRLVVHGTLYGLSLYGKQLSDLLEIEKNRYRVGMWMLGTAAGFGGAMAATNHYDRGSGFAKMLTTGSYAGFYYGILPDLWFERRRETRIDVFGNEVEVPNRRRIIGSMVGVPAGMLVMGALYRNHEVTDGEADATFFGSIVGVGYGVAAAYLADASKKSPLVEKRMYLAGTASLLPVGGFLGYRLAHEKKWSPGEVTVLGVGGVLGAYSGATVVRLMDGEEVSESAKPYVATMALAFPIGVAMTRRLTGDQMYSRNRAGIVTVGTVAGGLLGAGVVYVATNADDSRPYLLASSLAAMGTFALVNKATRTMTAFHPRERDGIAMAGTATQQVMPSPSSADVDSQPTCELASPSELLTAVALARLGADVPAMRWMTVRF